MKTPFTLFAISMSLSAQAQEAVVIPPNIVQACEQAGGCVIVPEKLLEQEMRKAYEAGRAEEAKKQKQCMKGSV